MTSNASFQTIISFLTNLGNQHIDVNSVFRFNRLELQGSLRKGLQKSIMLLDAIEVNTEKTNNINTHLNQCAFTILGKEGVSTSKIDAYDAQNEVLEHCQAIVFEIAARIKIESKKIENEWLYANLIEDSFSFFKVGPVFTENMYGYRCEFIIKSNEKYALNFDKWLDVNAPN